MDGHAAGRRAGGPAGAVSDKLPPRNGPAPAAAAVAGAVVLRVVGGGVVVVERLEPAAVKVVKWSIR